MKRQRSQSGPLFFCNRPTCRNCAFVKHIPKNVTESAGKALDKRQASVYIEYIQYF